MANFSKSISYCLIAALIVTTPLMAQEFRFGGQLSVVNPSGDLSKKAKLGIGAALSVEVCVSSHFAIQQNICYVKFGNKSKTKNIEHDENEFKFAHEGIGIFTDFIYRINSYDKGLFVFTGLGLLNTPSWTERDYSVSVIEPVIGISVGLGYKFNRHWGLEARYVKSGPFGATFPDPRPTGIRYHWIQASFIQRF